MKYWLAFTAVLPSDDYGQLTTNQC